MIQPEAIHHVDETAQNDESVASSRILDPATVTSPADCGLNLSADVPEAAFVKPQTPRSSTVLSKGTRLGLIGRLRSRTVRTLLTVASLLVIVGLIALNANRQPIIADSEANSEGLDLSEFGDLAADETTSDSSAEPRRHDFDTQSENHPLMRNAAQTRSTSGWLVESDWPVTDARSAIVPVANVTDSPLPATTSPPRRAPASGAQGAWLTGQIESDDSPMPSAAIRNVSANQAVPRRLPQARHPLAD